jgi:AraC family transcriptional regulator
MPERLSRGTYYGRSIAQHEVAGLILTEKRHRRGERLPPHAHDQPYLCFVLSGSWRERYDGGIRACAPRSIIYHPPGEIHSDHFDVGGAHLFAIEFDVSWLRRIQLSTHPFGEPHEFSGGQVSTTALRMYDEARRADQLSPLVLEGLMLELLGACMRSRIAAPHSAPPWIGDVEERLREEFRDPPSLGALAARVGVHRMHLARAFRQHYGASVGEFVRQRRLDFVCRELVASERPVAELALEAGFADQSHLTKIFNRALGTTPARYRTGARRSQGQGT